MRKSKWPLALTSLFILSFTFAVVGAESMPPTAKTSVPDRHDTTLVKKMKDVDIAQRQYMIDLTRQIGVTCTHCHDLKDFRNADKAAYKIGKVHMDMVRMLNEKYGGKIGEKVDCYMCHKGVSKPEYKEKREPSH